MKNLLENALLVNLKINQWTARRHDKQVSREIEIEHNSHNAGRFNKILINEDEMRKIQKVASAARTYLYDNTLPWSDGGDRLLPATNYFAFVGEFRTFKDQYEEAVSAFILKYDTLIEEARVRLNGMFRENDYPPITALQTKFNIGITFMPLSDLTDFRLQIDQKEVEKIKGQMQIEIETRIKEATQNIWERIRIAVGHMAEQLSKDDSKIHSSLVSNMLELIELLPRLNFTSDDEITDTIDSMKQLIVPVESLRTNKDLRRVKANEAQRIFDKVSEFIL
ncbi:DUF3150 domain-containing protein [Chitinophaga varians]|uniref:DUF3150 domain-containing protein n=1 Tax=Chitinophaga varians TaxID=2202339 RepID=UPI00165FEAFE|nr:DUF3150 domain-containing protein [Chitinophaga varians]MBC9909105.1 hypothetical protein [Chitinophaga varians]